MLKKSSNIKVKHILTGIMPGRKSPEEQAELQGLTAMQYQLKKMPVENRLFLKNKIKEINKRLTSGNTK